VGIGTRNWSTRGRHAHANLSTTVPTWDGTRAIMSVVVLLMTGRKDNRRNKALLRPGSFEAES
jgi:hypothetical protein